jgi:hypothetical protein
MTPSFAVLERSEVALEFADRRGVPWGASAFSTHLRRALATLGLVSCCEVMSVVLQGITYRACKALDDAAM